MPRGSGRGSPSPGMVAERRVCFSWGVKAIRWLVLMLPLLAGGCHIDNPLSCSVTCRDGGTTSVGSNTECEQALQALCPPSGDGTCDFGLGGNVCP
jgi:hypothetical protein